MHPYLRDTEYAAQNLIRLAMDEALHLDALSKELSRAEERVKLHQWDFQTSDLSEDFSDAYVMAAFGRAARSAQEADQLRREVVALQASIGFHQQATQAIAGAILQIAKQGLSLVFGGMAGVPKGRKIGSLHITDIIMQGRNQSLHHEERAFKQPVVEVFRVLELEQGERFSLSKHPGQNRARQVAELLGWTSYAAYAQDMEMLLGPPPNLTA
ncbi:MAG: hypothetical protein JNM90_01885 [Burkholderiales bacterium]|nr:hypothetical protein [Burkholderiales bacterium]